MFGMNQTEVKSLTPIHTNVDPFRESRVQLMVKLQILLYDIISVYECSLVQKLA